MHQMTTRSMTGFVAAALIFGGLLVVSTDASPTVYNANPENYRNLLVLLQPGDTLSLVSGTYTRGLPIHNLNGSDTAPITIMGPFLGARAIFAAQSCCNTVSIADSSYVRILNLQLDGRDLP